MPYATPSSWLDLVRQSAAALQPSVAFATAIPQPDTFSMSMSLSASPKAAVSSGRMPSRSKRKQRPEAFPASGLVSSILFGTDEVM